MNTKPSALSPLFRSDTQGQILARLLLNPAQSYTIAELARAAAAPYATTHREVSRAVEMGLATSTKRGQSVEIQAQTSARLFRPLAELLHLTYGPEVLLPRILRGVPGIDRAYIYGSWAARRDGEVGDAPGDIDLLIIGNPPRGAVLEAAQQAGTALGREVNARIVNEEAWASSESDPFLSTLKARPLVELDTSKE